jgi:hypothetical protein
MKKKTDDKKNLETTVVVKKKVWITCSVSEGQKTKPNDESFLLPRTSADLVYKEISERSNEAN